MRILRWYLVAYCCQVPPFTWNNRLLNTILAILNKNIASFLETFIDNYFGKRLAFLFYLLYNMSIFKSAYDIISKKKQRKKK